MPPVPENLWQRTILGYLTNICEFFLGCCRYQSVERRDIKYGIGGIKIRSIISELLRLFTCTWKTRDNLDWWEWHLQNLKPQCKIARFQRTNTEHFLESRFLLGCKKIQSRPQVLSNAEKRMGTNLMRKNLLLNYQIRDYSIIHTTIIDLHRQRLLFPVRALQYRNSVFRQSSAELSYHPVLHNWEREIRVILDEFDSYCDCSCCWSDIFTVMCHQQINLKRNGTALWPFAAFFYCNAQQLGCFTFIY